MGIQKTYAVFGLGRYGQAVAQALVESGAEVLAVDSNESVVNALASDIPYCKCADVTDHEVIKRLGISNMDVVIIAMARSLEASIMATMLCKEVGVKTVIAKASSEMNKKILLKVGADRVVVPESESGTRLAKELMSSGFVDIIELAKDVSIVELPVKTEWVGKNLIELNLRQKHSINVVALVQDKEVIVEIDPKKPLTKNMKMIVIAHTSKLRKLQ